MSTPEYEPRQINLSELSNKKDTIAYTRLLVKINLLEHGISISTLSREDNQERHAALTDSLGAVTDALYFSNYCDSHRDTEPDTDLLIYEYKIGAYFDINLDPRLSREEKAIFSVVLDNQIPTPTLTEDQYIDIADKAFQLRTS